MMNPKHAGINGRFLIIAISLALTMGIFMSLMLLNTVSAKSGPDATSRLNLSNMTVKLTGNQASEFSRFSDWQAKATAAVTGTATVKVPLLTELTLPVTGASGVSIPVTVLDAHHS